MNKETASQNLGAFFTLSLTRCQIVQVDSFGGILHFGITWKDSTGAFFSGWIPCNLCPPRELTE
jgi:hypothetical protein